MYQLQRPHSTAICWVREARLEVRARTQWICSKYCVVPARVRDPLRADIAEILNQLPRLLGFCARKGLVDLNVARFLEA